MKIYNLPEKISLTKSILWQYSNAYRLKQIIFSLEEAANITSVELWQKIDNIFDINKPITQDDDLYLKNIGLMLVMNLFGIQKPSISDELQEYKKLETLRRYIKGTIFLMDCDGSVADINKWLKIVFPDITCHVEDRLDMTIKYAFPDNLDEMSLRLIQMDGFLPRPAGVLIGDRVEIKTKTLSTAKFFDDDETSEISAGEMSNLGLNTFDNANFITEE